MNHGEAHHRDTIDHGVGNRGKIMDVFVRVYDTFNYLTDLPFSIRRAPITEVHSRVNGKGQTFYSWRAEVSDYLFSWEDNWDEYKRWDSPANRVLMFRNRLCAAEGTRPLTKEAVERSDPFPDTVMMAIVGPDTALERERQGRLCVSTKGDSKRATSDAYPKPEASEKEALDFCGTAAVAHLLAFLALQML